MFLRNLTVSSCYGLMAAELALNTQ